MGCSGSDIPSAVFKVRSPFMALAPHLVVALYRLPLTPGVRRET